MCVSIIIEGDVMNSSGCGWKDPGRVGGWRERVGNDGNIVYSCIKSTLKTSKTCKTSQKFQSYPNSDYKT